MMIPKFRRRKEMKTDYHSRLALIKSGEPRMVVRTSNSHTTVQFVKWMASGDVTVVSATTAQLVEHGWKSGTGNVPAAYLVGILAGNAAKKAGITKAVLDIGLAASTRGGRIYAALKGALDAGVNVNHDAAMLPSEDRINGKHIATWSAAAKKPNFSKYGMAAADLPKHTAEVKNKIMKV